MNVFDDVAVVFHLTTEENAPAHSFKLHHEDFLLSHHNLSSQMSGASKHFMLGGH
jgi:hypothetical protein